jgi:hypothetical protein
VLVLMLALVLVPALLLLSLLVFRGFQASVFSLAPRHRPQLCNRSGTLAVLSIFHN